MSAAVKHLRIATAIQATVLGLALAGCVGTKDLDNGLYYRPPEASGAASVGSGLDPAEVAQALREAGFTDVRRVGTDTVVLRSADPRLVDCGMLMQVAEGNAAEFAGNAPRAVLIEGFVTPGLIQRDMTVASQVRLTRSAGGDGYAVQEQHMVTRHFTALEGNARSRASVSFDEAAGAAFSDGTSCQSSGLIAGLLK
jgi:hypothetical protein